MPKPSTTQRSPPVNCVRACVSAAKRLYSAEPGSALVPSPVKDHIVFEAAGPCNPSDQPTRLIDRVMFLQHRQSGVVEELPLVLLN